jgi:hypothetical protein
MRTIVRWIGITAAFVILSLGLPALATSRVVPRVTPVAAPPSVASLPASLVADTLDRRGTVLRRTPDATVARVAVPERLMTDATIPASVFRVTVRGTFPPRGLRYVVLAGGRAVGYGIPARNERAVRTITVDAAVLTGRIRVRAGTGLARPAVRTGRTRPAPPSAVGRTSLPPLPRAAARGPSEVVRKVYDFGDEALQLTGITGKVELRADVHYPRGLPDGPYPIVLFLHGNHSACYKGDRSGYEWPCRDTWAPLPNFEGYDYLARRLASHGFIVVSVSGNGVNVLGNQVGDTGMRQRGELLEAHLDLWRTWSTVGGDPFGSRFVGKVDMTRTGTMGHSRGGEGAVWQVIVDRERPDPYGIDAVLPIAPVDFTRATVSDVGLAVLLPYCDGDVYDLQGVHFFDDARYAAPGDRFAKQTVTVMGANHNFFNTVWTPASGYPGAFDDGVRNCRGRLTAPQERAVGIAYVVSYFRRYLGGTDWLDPIWTGAATPGGIGSARTLVSYLAPDRAATRLDIVRDTSAGDLSTSQLGSPITTSGLGGYGWCADTYDVPCVPGQFAYNDIHLPGLGQGVIGWTGTDGMVRIEIPAAGGDVSRFDALQFRGALNPGYDWANSGVAYQDLSVVLVDGSGNRASVAASEVGNAALGYPSGLRRGWGHMILNQVRFPLDRFAGVDLTDVVEVRMRFDRTDRGVIDIADLAFTAGTA